MIVKVICDKCKSEFNWSYGKSEGNCPVCGPTFVRNVKLAKGEIKKLFRD